MDSAQSDALKLVPENMATIYQIVPLRFEDDILTVALASGNEWVPKEIEKFTGVKRVDYVVWSPDEIEKGLAERY